MTLMFLGSKLCQIQIYSQRSFYFCSTDSHIHSVNSHYIFQPGYLPWRSRHWWGGVWICYVCVNPLIGPLFLGVYFFFPHLMSFFFFIPLGWKCTHDQSTLYIKMLVYFISMYRSKFRPYVTVKQYRKSYIMGSPTAPYRLHIEWLWKYKAKFTYIWWLALYIW